MTEKARKMKIAKMPNSTEKNIYWAKDYVSRGSQHKEYKLISINLQNNAKI